MGEPHRHGRPEGREAGTRKGPTSIYRGRTGGHTGGPSGGGCHRFSGGVGELRGVAAATTPDRTSAVAATPVDTRRYGTIVKALIVRGTGTDANTVTSDGDHGNGDFDVAATTWGAGPGCAVTTNPRSQRLVYDGLFFVWQTGPWGGPVSGVR